MSVEIRSATIDNKARIQEILSIYNMGNFGHSEREEMPPIDNFLVAYDRGRIIGCAAFLLDRQSKLTVHDKQAETGSLAVLPEYRGKGVGHELQVARLLRLTEMGIETLFTETDTPENIDWYTRKFGYVKLHTRRKNANFCDPNIHTFTLLELDLQGWSQRRRIRKLLDSTPGIDVSWFNTEYFGNLSDLKPDTSRKLIINAAITGMVPKRKDSRHVPLTSEEIITDAERCYKAGATIVHLHARDENENPTFKSDVYREFVPEIRKRCRNIVINITTSGRLYNTFECRSEVLNLTGEAKPDMASLTVGSNNFPGQASVNSPEMIQDLAKKMLEKGIRPELEIFEVGMINYANYMHRKGLIRNPLYFNLLLGSLGAIPARIKDLHHLLNTLPQGAIWAATGIGRFQLPINLAAIIKGGHVRVGLEDNLYFDDARTILATNEQLIQRLVRFATELGRGIATPEETRSILELSS